MCPSLRKASVLGLRNALMCTHPYIHILCFLLSIITCNYCNVRARPVSTSIFFLSLFIPFLDLNNGRYMMFDMLEEALQPKLHIFSSFFYTRLSNASMDNKSERLRYTSV